MIPKLLPADIILSCSDAWISKQIRDVGKLASGSCRVSHASLALGNLTEKPECIESLWKVTRSPISKYENEQIVIWRNKTLSRGKRNEIALKMVSIERDGYGLLKLPLFFLDAVFKTYFFTQHFGVSNFKVCSEAIAWAYEKALNKPSYFGCGWRSVSPDIIDDQCSANVKEWECVYDSISKKTSNSLVSAASVK